MFGYQDSYEYTDEKNEHNSCDLNNQSIISFVDEKKDFRERLENFNIFSESNRPTDDSDDKEERNEIMENEIIENGIFENEKREENSISTPNNDDMYIISKDDILKPGQEEDEMEEENDKFLSKKTDRSTKTKTTKCSDDNIR